MEYAGQTIVVTGGAKGIGAAIVDAFTAQGASVWVLDIDAPVGDVPERYFQCDVSDQQALSDALAKIESDQGGIDVFVSNAGVMSQNSGENGNSSVEDWARCWSVNVMAHVYAAHALVPSMIARGGGRFVVVASAAGLLNQIGDAAYSATKHAAVSFAESLAIHHADDGIAVSVVCPQYVATGMIGLGPSQETAETGLLTAEEIADCVLKGLSDKSFLILPHPEVERYAQQRAKDHDRWIAGMIKLKHRAKADFGRLDPTDFYKLV